MTKDQKLGSALSWPEYKLKNWRDFMEMAERTSFGPPTQSPYIFRGQAREKWFLLPSLARLALQLNLQAREALEVEKHILSNFRAQAHLYLSPNIVQGTKDDKFGWWTLMQHYHAPTRLLDWTASIFVAAYYAVVEAWDDDGAIWMFHNHSLTEGMKKRFPTYEVLPLRGEHKKFDEADAPAELQLFVRHELTDRMIAQQGGFTVCKQILADHGEVIGDAISDDGSGPKRLLLKLIVEKEFKSEFLNRLRDANITANALFPGIDGLGRSLEEFARLHANYLKTQTSPDHGNE